MRRRIVLGMEGTQNWAVQLSQGEGTLRLRTGVRQPPLYHAGASLLFLGLPPPFFAPPLWVVSVVIYSSLPFILLLHLLVLHAYSQVHVLSAILSDGLWATVASIVLSRGHIHIEGGQGVSCAHLIWRWQLLGAASPPIPLWLAHMAWNLFGDPRVDVLGRNGSFFSHDFCLPRTGSSSAVRFGNLDSLHFIAGHFFLFGVGLGFEMEWAEASRTFWPHSIFI